MRTGTIDLFTVLLLLLPAHVRAQSGVVTGMVHDESRAALPGAIVELRTRSEALLQVTDEEGRFRFVNVDPGPAQLSFSLIQFASVRRAIVVPATGTLQVDAVMRLSLGADVTVTGKSTFTNLADVENPTQSLVGIAQSASQGAITARQLDARPLLRSGEVLETVSGVAATQHSGEGKANQYFLRGFNLDHGTDFATTVAGLPVNMPTHGHGHGYSDLSFLIPELVSGVHFSKGPYFAEHGDFATAGAANITYVNALPSPLTRITAGGQGFARALAAASWAAGQGTILAAIEVHHNDGPWERADDYRKVNGLIRYSRGNALTGLSATFMGYQGRWNATDQVPSRALADGRIGRFGTLDETDGGDSYRYSGSFEWQRTRGNARTRVSAFGMAYDLNLFSNFTYFLEDPQNGDQFQQADHRFVTGGRIVHQRSARWSGRQALITFGAQLRNDVVSNIGLYRTRARRRLGTIREDDVVQTSAGAYLQHETEWGSWLRTLAGLRVDGYRFDVNAGEPANGGTAFAGLVSPKGGAVFGPWLGTELYANAGLGFHSNDARGATITVDPVTAGPADRVTPLARATGAEIGIRSVSLPRLQVTAALWMLRLDSELVFVGDAGTTEAGRPSHRQGIEMSAYYSPLSWLTLDGDASWARARFRDEDPAGRSVPGAVERVLSAGATVDSNRALFGSLRLRYFGPRALTEDGGVRSAATSLINLSAGYRLTRSARIVVDVFNLLDARHSDIDYFYVSRLPGEPDSGIGDVHVHPALPRTARVSLIVAF
jgi:TonB dependent receptor/TonB-dependent Receptor Plug Domain/Carboxypeptidase regulatory-like domain